MAASPTLTWIWLDAAGRLGDRTSLPRDPGSYLLVLALLRSQRRLPVGGLGSFALSRGIYAYCGSACGPGGIRGRLTRHLRASTTLRWHVDFLLRYARPMALAFAIGDPPRECGWSQRLGQLPNASFPVPGFGASDCRRNCPAHLVLLSTRPRPSLPPASPEQERTCAKERQAVKEAILFLLETLPHEAGIP
ncbi:DUF123 domain-containing protein [Methylacidimicrobium sp. B4]|uniref:GIY-YIG nuclease family protein n=1 Tax=Methylacidimicrobium sp. B4 TaxID=2796139 RepID=UPI001A90836C|nr:GIY-YIG nuclease family protein [Methylacidimicrobium sp. B4]QSR84755.1 GIY-YIG nuclease family protein [Methylacidimicrobium sp. B4]